MNSSGRSLGGEEHGVAPQVAGSSPAVPTIKTTSRATLHRMLRDLDRDLHVFDVAGRYKTGRAWELLLYRVDPMKLDAKRRAVRERLKQLGARKHG